jgi:uncharacterized protein
MPCVVADTSPLFYLAKLGRFALLRDLYGWVHIPPEVWRETLAGGRVEPALSAIFLEAESDGWLVISAVTPLSRISGLNRLDAGEQEAISLAKELGAKLIIDEKRGRIVAAELGLTVTGTLGVLVDAKRDGLIPALGPELARLRRETGFRFSEKLAQLALRRAGETSE